MDIRQLKYFAVVADEKNFTKASKILHVSQPALTKAIKNMEEELAVPLFSYHNKKMELTSVGELLYNQSRTLLYEFDSILDEIKGEATLKKGLIRIGLPPLVSTIVFPKLVEGFVRKYPGIELSVNQAKALDVQYLVRDNVVDVAFTLRPIISVDFDVIDIFEDEQVLVMSKDHPLANKSELSIRDVKDYRFILLDETYMSYNQIISACHREGFNPQILMRITNWDLVLSIVKLNLGITILPKPIVELYPDEMLRTVRLVPKVGEFKICMISNKKPGGSFSVETFKQFIMDNREIHANK